MGVRITVATGFVTVALGMLLLAAPAFSQDDTGKVTAQSRPGRGEESMEERKGLVTLKGNPVTLVGNVVNVGDMAPDCTLTDNNLQPVKLSSFLGKTTIISAVPSLDTPVCDMESRRFNQEAAKLGEDVTVLTVSMDLPFAQKRWCGAHEIKNVQTLSDYREASFGRAYGVLMKEPHLLARCVFVVDKQGRVQYVQLVPEVSTEPNYDEVIRAVRKLK